MKRIEVHYTAELIIKNTSVKPDGCNSMSLENIGAVEATIESVIPLGTADVAREFNNENPRAILVKPLNVTFNSSGTGKSILVIRTFKKVID